jgi:hypothetical protein
LSVRVYLPATLTGLPALLRDRRLPGGPGCAVTPALREWYSAGGDDELEYAALLRAARQSLELLADDVRAPRRRVVLAADVPEAAVRFVAGDEPAAVVVDDDIPLSAVQAVHVDGEDAVPLVRAALVEPEDEMAQGDLEDADLLWYATQELDQLLAG